MGEENKVGIAGVGGRSVFWMYHNMTYSVKEDWNIKSMSSSPNVISM